MSITSLNVDRDAVITGAAEVVTPLPSDRLRQAKRAYTTRRVALENAAGLALGRRPKAGDLVLARVLRLGQHTGLNLPSGRRATLFPGDEIIVCYGNRYAPDQFEAFVPDDLGPCHLVAAGGIAASARSWHSKMRKPTEIEPLGLLVNRAGQTINVYDGRLPDELLPMRLNCPVIAVAGTAMNAGKTTAAANLIRGLTNAGLRVGAAKITGTGAPGDVMLFGDAGALTVLDFTDFGLASTCRATPQEIERVLRQSVAHINRANAEVAVVEIADGLFQAETAALVASPIFRRVVSGLVFAAGDAMGAAAGVEWLEHRGLPVIAVAGLLTASPLAIAEARAATHLPVLSSAELADGGMACELLTSLDQRLNAAGTRA